MRILRFGTEQTDKERFDIIYGGLIVSPRGFNRAESRVVKKVMEKLEAIAKPIQDARGLVKFELGDGGEVLLEDAEYKLLDDALAEVKWTATTARMVEDADEFFKAAPDPEKEKAKAKAEAEKKEAAKLEIVG